VIFSDRHAYDLQSCSSLGPFHVVRDRTAVPVTRGELKSNGPTRVGELGRSWKATDRGWGLKIRRLLRCPASTHSQIFRPRFATTS
jgi:hypothetical protein